MASSKKFVASTKPRDRKPSNPYYTRHSDKRANLSMNVNRDNNAKNFTANDMIVNQATMSVKVYSGSRFELYLRGDEVILRTLPQVKNYNISNLALSRIKLHEIAIGIKLDDSFEAYSDRFELLDTVATYLDIPTDRILHLAENYCKNVSVASDRVLIHQSNVASKYQNQIKKLASKVTYR